MPRILIVDDEPGIRQSLTGVFEDEGFNTEAVGSGEDCLKKFELGAYDLVLLDVWLPGMDGMETLRRLREISPDTHVIMISGHGTVENAVEATKKGAFDFVNKPPDLNCLLITVRNAFEKSNLVTETKVLKRKVGKTQIGRAHV